MFKQEIIDKKFSRAFNGYDSEEQNGPRKQDMEERAEGNGGNCWQNSDLKYSKASGKPQAVEDIHL